MILDELVSSIKADSSDPDVVKLADLLSQWTCDDSNVEDLEFCVERHIGNTWSAREEEHKKICRLWSEFKSDAVRGIHGMTMNERLFSFGLMSRFDAACTEKERKIIYAKLLAEP